MKIDIEDQGGTVSVKIQTRPIHRKDYNVKVKFTTKDVLKHLEQQNIKVGKCLKNPSLVTNKAGLDKLSGEWVFEKPKRQVQSRKKSKKVEKVLDKTPKDVIIEVEKKESPQPPEKDSALTEE